MKNKRDSKAVYVRFLPLAFVEDNALKLFSAQFLHRNLFCETIYKILSYICCRF